MLNLQRQLLCLALTWVATVEFAFGKFPTKVLVESPTKVLVESPTGSLDDHRPNVIVIISDDQGWADIGYNNPRVYTPNLDRLAATGITFVNHYVMPQCTPTRVATLTGRFPSRFGGPAMSASNQPAIPKGTPTLANMFTDSGYDTFLCGKWHLGSTPEFGPNHFGFQSSYGSLAGAIGMYDHRYRKGKFAETWHRDHQLIDGWENGVHATDLVSAEAIRYIGKKHEKPFFMYLAFHAVHTPLDERGKFVDQPTQLDPNHPNRWKNEDQIQWFNDPAGKIQSEPDPEKRLLLAAANHLDYAIGQVIQALDQSGQRENTLILFSSDNGPQGSWGGQAYPDDLKLTDFNQPLPIKGMKLDVWEGGIHVPAFANWKGKIPSKKVEDPVHIVDWFPTLAKVIGYQPETNLLLDGVDLTPVLLRDQAIAKRDLYWTWGWQINRWALRSGDWKIVKYGQGEPAKPSQWQLFNLTADPKEANDLAAEKTEILASLHQDFLEQRKKDRLPELEKKKP